MQLEDYFEFEKFPTEYGDVERIRVKGHHDQCVAPGTGCDPGIKPLHTHGSW